MKKWAVLLLAVCTIFSLGFITKAEAVPWAKGYVFAGISNGQVAVFDSAGNLLETLNDGQGGFTTGMAFDSAGNLYSTNFSASNVVKYLGPNDPHTNSIWAANDAGAHNESILFNKTGQVYIGQPDGTHDIIKRDAAGNFLARYDVAISGRGTDWIDLAADQKTMFYSGEGRIISRFDVSANTQLADFATLPGTGNAYALRLLGGGGLLIADASNIKRLDALGNVIQTYDANNQNQWFALNLDPDGKSFWSGSFDTNQFFKFDIATGAILVGPINSGGSLFGLTVFGEITQGGGDGKVPEPATMILIGSGLLGLAGLRKKFKK